MYCRLLQMDTMDFLKLFNHYYCKSSDKAKPIAELINHFEAFGTDGLHAKSSEIYHFNAIEWSRFSEKEKQEIVMSFRLAYRKRALSIGVKPWAQYWLMMKLRMVFLKEVGIR